MQRRCGPNIPIADLQAFCQRVGPDLILLSIVEYQTDEEAERFLQSLEMIATTWPVVIGGQGASAMSHLIGSRHVEVLDDSAALNARAAATAAR